MDRYSSNLSKAFRIWHLKCFKNLRLFMTMRHICSWQHQATSRGRRALKRLLKELVDHLARNCSCLDCVNKLDMKDPKRNDC